MDRQVFLTGNAPTPVAPISHAVKANGFMFVSGNTGRVGDGPVATGSFEVQCRQTLRNIETIVTECGGSLDNVVKVNVYLGNPEDFDEMNRIYQDYFKKGNFPARTTIVVSFAKPGILVEIECIVAL